MKPAIYEHMLDDVIVRTLLNSRPAAVACLIAALPQHAESPFDNVTIRQQVRHLGVPGTADLVVSFWNRGRISAMLLIENKIDARFTPDQPKRYRASCIAHMQTSTAPLVATLLMCPSAYIDGSKLKSAFDGSISYETIRPFVDPSECALLDQAIQRAESPYEPEPQADVMSFFEGYASIAQIVAPDLIIKKNPNSGAARPAASRTIYFDASSSGVRNFPFLMNETRQASVSLAHQCWDSSAPSPSVKLMLRGWAKHIRIVSPILQPLLVGRGIHLRSAGQSLALVSDTERLDNRQAAEDQRTQIMDALVKLQGIKNTWNRLESELREASHRVRISA